MTSTNADEAVDGRTHPPIVANWLGQINGEPLYGTLEFPMFSDADFSSEVRTGCGPYSFLNGMTPAGAPGTVRDGFFFRCHFHWAYPFSGGSLATDEANYHGGWLQDEASALASLALGARVRSGDYSRTFNAPNDDTLGSPKGARRAFPSLFPKHRRFIIPSATGARSLSDLSIFSILLKLTPDQGVSLLRSAMLYQDALWIAESEPELAWLMLVSALETGALSWQQQGLSSIGMLEAVRSDFVLKLRAKGEDVLALVAGEVGPLFKAAAKFQTFCMHFLPDAPAVRPHKFQQIKWTRSGWKDIFSTVYAYRSRALHSGVPFPHPMCEPPGMRGSDSVPCEKGTDALAVRALGASWAAKDIPVSLDTFTQVTRKILLAWWRHMADDAGVPSGG